MLDQTIPAPSVAPGQADHPLEFIFHPRAIAIVGASSNPDGQGNGFVMGPKEHGFAGPIYPINPKAKEIAGLSAYPSVLAVPGPLDYVISSIPAAGVPELLRQCGKKGVRFVHLFTAGFRETGDRTRTALEQHILHVARQEGIRLLGPNCMGVYYPEGHLTFQPDFPREPGNIGMISQSGTNASETVSFGGARGLRFSKVFSYGNALDLNESDLVEYLATDPNTHYIGAYIEGLSEGRRFFQVLREAARRKPVVILKGGRTQAGTRAISSHTGSLAGADVVWDTACRQAGAIRVFGVEELVDILMTLASGVRPTGRRVAILGGGGGASVLAADDCNALGLEVPAFSAAVQEQLRPLVHEAGTSVRNPVDAGTLLRNEDIQKAVQIIGGSGEVDAFFVHVSSAFTVHGVGRGKTAEDAARPLKAAARLGGKPFFVVLRNEGRLQGNPENLQKLVQGCVQAGLPVFPSMSRAGNALAKVLQHATRDWEPE
ncbi:MAG: CoA-binding protein [Chloroflexi bacterium]|nr:CoA-binding protein [Chloroflexota bacterium]